MQNKVGKYNLKLGDWLQHLDLLVEGAVVEIKPKTTVIRTLDGFDYEFDYSELIALPRDGKLDSLLNSKMDIDIHEKEGSAVKRSSSKRKKGQDAVPEYDLHIEKLLDKHSGMSNGEIVQYQLDCARQKIEVGIRNKTPRIVFIHGVGEGVLRDELIRLCRQYEQLDAQPANPRKYGQGATLVYIRQRN